MCVAYAQARTHTAHPHVRTCVLSENSNTSGGRTPTEPQTTRHTTHNAVTQNEQSDRVRWGEHGAGVRVGVRWVGWGWGWRKGEGRGRGGGGGGEEGGGGGGRAGMMLEVGVMCGVGMQVDG